MSAERLAVVETEIKRVRADFDRHETQDREDFKSLHKAIQDLKTQVASHRGEIVGFAAAGSFLAGIVMALIDRLIR